MACQKSRLPRVNTAAVITNSVDSKDDTPPSPHPHPPTPSPPTPPTPPPLAIQGQNIRCQRNSSLVSPLWCKEVLLLKEPLNKDTPTQEQEPSCYSMLLGLFSNSGPKFCSSESLCISKMTKCSCRTLAPPSSSREKSLQ